MHDYAMDGDVHFYMVMYTLIGVFHWNIPLPTLLFVCNVYSVG